MEFETGVQKTVKAKGRGTDITISICLNSIHDLVTHALRRIIYFGSHLTPVSLLLTWVQKLQRKIGLTDKFSFP